MKNVILVSGKLRSGKNQFAEYLKTELENMGLTVKQDFFAYGVKNGSKEDFKILIDYLNEIFKELGKEELITRDENWFESKNPITRKILQIYGTNIFRNRVDTNWWVDQQIKRIKESKEEYHIITDVRFPNEIEGICVDGFNIVPVRVQRNIDESNDELKHESETALDNYENFSYIIDNNGTLEELKDSANVLAQQLLSFYMVK